MELLQMKYFYDTANSGSFTKTAEKYMVPTSSVSAAVKRLEKELGCELFDRSANKITLNDEGKSFKASLDIVFSELESAKARISPQGNQRTTIRVLAKTMRHDVVWAMLNYHKLHPYINFVSTCEMSRSDWENFDIIIDTNEAEYPGYNKYELNSYKLYLRCNVGSKYASGKYLLKDFKNEPFITFGEHSNLHKSLVNACKKAGFVPNIVMTSDDSKCIDIMRKKFDGISISRTEKPLTESTARINVTDFNETHTICLYSSKNTDKSIAENFAEFLKKTY